MKITKKILAVAFSILALHALAACDSNDAAEDVGEKIDDAAEEVGDKVEDATD